MRRCCTLQASQLSVNLKSSTGRNGTRIRALATYRMLHSTPSISRASHVLCRGSGSADTQNHLKLKNRYSPNTVTRRFLAHYDKPRVLEVDDGEDDHIPMIEPEIPHIDYVGIDLVFDRTTKIINVIAQRGFYVIMQTHLNPRFVDFLAGATNYEVRGITDCPEVAKKAREKIEYSIVDVVDYTKELPISEKSLSFVVHLIPCPEVDLEAPVYVHPTMVKSPSLEEVFRIVNEEGYVIIGAAKQVWESEKMMEQIEKLEDRNEVIFMTMQMVPLDRPMDPNWKEYTEEGATSQNAIDWDEKEEMYVICTLRKP